MGVVLVSQFMTFLMLFWACAKDVDHRAIWVGLSITGLGLSLVTKALVRFGSLGIFLCACFSLMISFWPNVGLPGTSFGSDPLILRQTDEEPTGEYRRISDGDEENALLGGSDDESSDGEFPALTEETRREQQASPSRIRGTRRLLQLAAPQVLYLYAGCAVLLVRLPFSLSIPHFVATTLSALAKGEFDRASREISLLIVMGTIDAALDFWCVFLFGYANQRIVRGLRVDLFRKVIRQDVAFFDVNSSGQLASRLNSDCSEMAGDLTWFFRFSIESVVRITGITAYMLLRSPTLGACAVSIVPLVAIVNKVYGDWLRKNAIQVQDALAEANEVAQEALSNVRTVIAFAAENRECKHYEDKVERQFQLSLSQLFWTSVYYMGISTFLINTIVQAMLLGIGASLIMHNKLSAEVLLAFMLFQSQLQNETLNLFQSYSSLIKSSGAGDTVFALLDRQPPPPAIENAGVRAEENEGTGGTGPQQYDVKLEDISFQYPSRPDQRVLHGFSLDIPKGKTIALVGASGSGKSTVVSLLQRFYDPNRGTVLINGQDLRSLDLWEHRRSIGVVSQDPVLFGGTLFDNITYGLPTSRTSGTDSSLDEEVSRVARMAKADDFVVRFRDGFQTDTGEGGVQLSGGQKQRISIARAIIMSPCLLLLDEATSSLDTEKEAAVQEALDQLLEERKDMTTLIIAHRLSTIRYADRIAVVQDGRVIEQGSHDELIDMVDGVYRRMVEGSGDSGVLPE